MNFGEASNQSSVEGTNPEHYYELLAIGYLILAVIAVSGSIINLLANISKSTGVLMFHPGFLYPLGIALISVGCFSLFKVTKSRLVLLGITAGVIVSVFDIIALLSELTRKAASLQLVRCRLLV